MESMVNLPNISLEALYRAGLAHLKAGKVARLKWIKFFNGLPCFQFHEAIKSLETVKKSVEEGAHYGEYVIYKYERQVLIHIKSSV